MADPTVVSSSDLGSISLSADGNLVISAIGVAVGRGSTPAALTLAQRLETAMSDAVALAQRQGISDQDVIRQRILDARDQVLGA